MKIVLLFLTVCCTSVFCALTCFGDESKCGEDECCIQLGTTIAGICRKNHNASEFCEMNPLKNVIKKHVYKVRCPCRDGLKCIAKEGLVGKVAGKCMPDTDSTDLDED